MLEDFFRGSWRIKAVRGGPNGSLVEAFAKELGRAGYAEITARRHIRTAEHLTYWMKREGVPIEDLTETLIGRFVGHLKQCRCPRYSRVREELLRGARKFMEYLRASGFLTVPAKSADQDPVLFAAFRRWMRQQRGTCDATLYNYGLHVKALLARLGDDPGSFDARNLRQFVLETSQRSGWARAKTCTTALRMFLRFLIAEGRCADGLAGAVPILMHRRLSSLPRYIMPEEVERVIASCNRSTPAGRRDHAILLLLARMGLRAGDIVQLCLEDIDWSEADLRVLGKGRRETRLPLTQEVGDAIVEYLRAGRPRTDADALFVRAHAPFRALANHCAVSVIVGQALRRAGVSCPSRGAAHVLATLLQRPCSGMGRP